MRCREKFYSPLFPHMKQFIEYKRSLGRKYETEQLTLGLFERFLMEQKVISISLVTPELVLKFLASRNRPNPRSYNHLLGVLREFFRWMVARQIIRKSPVTARPKRKGGSRIPVILKPKEVNRLLELADSLSDNYGGLLRGPTYKTVFAVLYSLGLRIGEVSRLRVEDIKWEENLLLIRRSKFGKTRLVPFGPKIGKLIKSYLELRRRRSCPLSAKSPVFSVHGKLPIRRQGVGKVLRKLSPQIGFSRSEGRSPRVHDLRHSFAVL